MWWKKLNIYFLNLVLSKINDAKERQSSIDRCSNLFDALNQFWQACSKYFLPEEKLSDNKALSMLLMEGINKKDRIALIKSSKLKDLVFLEPMVMNHDTLRKANYDPFNIPEKLRKKAQDEHKQLVNAYNRYFENNVNEEYLKPLLKKLAQLIYVIRSNIKHGEKTQSGPDLEKVKRDKIVCHKTAPLIELILELILEMPSQKLAVYGTLKPGGVNHSIIKDIGGEWLDCSVKGEITTFEDLPVFIWDRGKETNMKLLISNNLSENFERLDNFEGLRYKRILIPVQTHSGVFISNIYSLRKINRSRDDR